MVELKNICKTFNRDTVDSTRLFADFNISIEKGDFISIVGSNGSGKTTLLNIISGSVAVDSGNVLLDGKDITNIPEYKRARNISRVFQDPSVGTVPNMTILENLSVAANKGKPFDLKFAVDTKLKNDFCEMIAGLGLGLENNLNKPVGSLSGGQRQALSLIMSTIVPPDILLLDEHTAALDPKTAETVMQLTRRLIKEKDITAVMVTHNLRYAVEYGNRMIMLDKGKIVLDISGEKKAETRVDDLLQIFNSISIECGN